MPPGIPYTLTMPRKRKELAPPAPPTPETTALVIDPRIAQIFEKYGDPLEAMARMADELEGNIYSDDALSTRARLLTELAKYKYAQFKTKDSDSAMQQGQKVEITLVGIDPPKITAKTE